MGGTGGTSWRVDLVEDVTLATRVFRRGTRGLGDPCRLTIALNGDERLHLAEPDPGDLAPAELVVDLRMAPDPGERTVRALTARPWTHPDDPVIVFAHPEKSSSADAVGFLVRTPAIDRVIDTIRSELDLRPADAGRTDPQAAARLDVGRSRG